MKQVLQSLRTGEVVLEDVPAPAPSGQEALIATTQSLLSAGTERMLVDFGRANWIEKARSQPDKVRQVLDKVRSDGLLPTVEAVQAKLEQPLALGYCNVGVIVEHGAAVRGLVVGDRVVSNGKHAELVAVPQNLCAKIPDGVSDEQAAFTVLAAIGLQGVRLINPSLGECIAVSGLGLIGLLTVQILRANGCKVLGLDFDERRLELAKAFGAEVVHLGKGEDPVAAALAHSRGRGVDGVIIAASTKSSDPVHQAAAMCRKRGRIVLVGVTGLELSRADFYEKELSFQVSCSYGPGRYDPAYEEGGQDYPVGFVRWTEQRNFEAVLDLMAAGSLNTDALITHRLPFDRALEAYQVLSGDSASLGIVLQYPKQTLAADGGRHVNLPSPITRGQVVASFIGTGNYAGRVLIPAFKNAEATLQTAVSRSGVSAVHYGKKFGFGHASSNAREAIEDAHSNTVVIATRHDSHARYALAALRAGKHVFVEKPLCLTLEELAEIEEEVAARPGQCLMVGFNRRFAPHVVKVKGLLQSVNEPKVFVMTVNAGEIPADHWTQDPALGGGRLVGEGCHFIDLLRHLAASPITHHSVATVGRHAALPVRTDKATIQLHFEDGSLGTIHYLANGHKSLAKERLEVFCAGRVLQLDNYRKLKGFGWPGFSRLHSLQQDKGQGGCVKTFVDAIVRGAAPPISREVLFEVARVSIEVQAAAEASSIAASPSTRVERH